MAETSPFRGTSHLEGSERSNSRQMQGLLNEFRGLYESRLRKLDEADRAGENTEKVFKFLSLCRAD